MAEILEKGLLIGFGLSVGVFFFALLSPYFSIIFSNTPTPLDQHDTFAFTMEYGLSYNPHEEDELHINVSLTLDYYLSLLYTGDELFLNISSSSKSTLLSSSRQIVLCNSSITGNIETIFSYTENKVTLLFRGRT